MKPAIPLARRRLWRFSERLGNCPHWDVQAEGRRREGDKIMPLIESGDLFVLCIHDNRRGANSPTSGQRSLERIHQEASTIAGRTVIAIDGEAANQRGGGGRVPREPFRHVRRKLVKADGS